jgi:hypothetical protein
LLASSILFFFFIYPSERKNVPQWLVEKLLQKATERISHEPTTNKITRGLLLSNDFQVGVSKFGFKPIEEMK